MEDYVVEYFNTEKNVIFFKVIYDSAVFLVSINLMGRNLRYLNVPEHMYVDTRNNELVRIQLPVQKYYIKDLDENGNLILYRMASQFEFDTWMYTNYNNTRLFDRRLQKELKRTKNKQVHKLIRNQIEDFLSENNIYDNPKFKKGKYKFKPDYTSCDEQVLFVDFVRDDDDEVDYSGCDFNQVEAEWKEKYENIKSLEEMINSDETSTFSPIWSKQKNAKVMLTPDQKKKKKDNKLPSRIKFKNVNDTETEDDEDEDVICIRTETEIPKDMNVNFELEKDSNDSMSLLSRKEKNKIIKEQERITSRFDPHILKTQFTPMPRKYATTMKKIEEEAKKKNKKNKN